MKYLKYLNRQKNQFNKNVNVKLKTTNFDDLSFTNYGES